MFVQKPPREQSEMEGQDLEGAAPGTETEEQKRNEMQIDGQGNEEGQGGHGSRNRTQRRLTLQEY